MSDDALERISEEELNEEIVSLEKEERIVKRKKRDKKQILHEMIKNYDQVQETSPSKKSIPTLTVYEKRESKKEEKKEEKEEKKEEIMEVEDQDEELEVLEKYKINNTINIKIKIKMVIAEIAKNPNQISFRKFFSPIASTLNLTNSPVGFFHTALIVGPFYLEWNSSSLCIPRKCYSTSALLAIDLKETKLKELNFDETMEKISKVICLWNVEKKYDRFYCNCQHFVDDLLKVLEITPDFKTTMKDVVSSMRTQGECKIEWKVPKEIQEKCLIKEGVKKFSTHEELDVLVQKILDKMPKFKKLYPEDYLLLKSFDRAFWLKFYRDKKNKEYWAKDPEDDKDCGCPFDNPEKTRSLCSEWW